MSEEPSRRDFLKYAVAGAAVAGAAAVGGSAYYKYDYLPSQTPKTINITLGLLGNMDELPAYVAHDMGFFKKYGLNSDVVNFPSPGPQTDALLSGRISFTNQALATFITRADQLNDYAVRLLNVTDWYGQYQGKLYPGGQAMVRSDLAGSIKSVTDLKGRTIASLGAGTFADAMGRILLTRAGLNPDKDVKILFASFPKMVEAFATKNIDFVFTIADPFKLQLVSQNYAQVFKDPTYIPNGISYAAAVGTDRVPITGVWTTESFLEANPGVCEAARRALTDTIVWMQSNPDQTAQVASKYTNLSADLTRQSLNDLLYLPYPSGFTDWNAYFTPIMNAMVAAKLLKGPIQLANLVTTPCFKPTQ